VIQGCKFRAKRGWNSIRAGATNLRGRKFTPLPPGIIGEFNATVESPPGIVWLDEHQWGVSVHAKQLASFHETAGLE